MKIREGFAAAIGILALVMAGCSGGGGDSGSTVNPTAPTGDHVQISGTVQPDPADPSANGTQSGATVYVIGQENNAVQTDGNGNFTLQADPQLSGAVLTSPPLRARSLRSPAARVASGTRTINFGIVVVNPAADATHGHKTNVLVVTDQTNTCPTIYVNTVGSITGHAYLQGQTDHSGITVYIPGTSFSAITAADGSYTISHVPSGTYEYLRAEKFGTTYHFAILSNITVTTAQQTTVDDMLLQISTGPFGSVLIDNGAAFTNSATVGLSIATSSDAVLMSVSGRSDFVGAAWEPVQATKQFTFTGDYTNGGGVANVYVKFAQESGLASSPITTAIYIDTAPAATLVSPVSVTMNQTPTLQWQYTPPMPGPLYHVQLANNPGFTSPVVDASGISAPQYDVPTTLSQGTYYWRVAITYGGTELAWGPVWSFTIDRTAGTLLAPANASKTNDTTPQFTWLQNPSASSYRLVLSTNPDLSAPVLDVTGITGNSYGPVPALPPAALTVYYWAITPYDSAGSPGTRSGVWSFTLDSVAPAGAGVPVSAPTGTGITINNDDTFTAMAGVTLSLAATDVNAVAAYLVSESPAAPSLNDTRWTAVIPTASLNVNSAFTLSSGSGVKTVYAWFKDAVGNISSTYNDSINFIDFSANGIQTIDQGGNGGFPSIAYAPGAGVNVVYIDEMNNSGVKWMTNYTGSWSWPTTLDPSPSVQTGGDHSIAAHFGTYDWSLHVAYSDGYNNTYYLYKAAIMRSPWNAKAVVDTASNTSSWNMPAIGVDSNNKAHIGYLGHDSLKYANNTLSSWSTYTIDNSGQIYGQSISLGVDANNAVYISYYDRTNDAVKVATNATGTWATTVIESGIGGTYKDVYTSLAIGKTNSVHVAYSDSTHGAIRYATKASGGSWGAPVTIYTLPISFYEALSIAVDTTTNAVYLCFYNSGSLRLATNAFGQWATAALTTNGYQPSIAVDGTGRSLHVAYFDTVGWTLNYTHAQY